MDRFAHKKILIGAFIAFFLVSVPVVVRAQIGYIDQQTQAFAQNRGAGYGNPVDPRLLVANIIKLSLSALGMLFLAYTVYAGMRMVTSAGDEGKMSEAKSTLRTAVIGVIIILGAYSITAFVTSAIIESVSTQDSFRFWTTPGDPPEPNRDPLSGQTQFRGPYYDTANDESPYYQVGN